MTGYELDGLGSISNTGKIIFSFYSIQAQSAAHPVSYPMDTVGQKKNIILRPPLKKLIYTFQFNMYE
jgi:hypothetical protein